MSTMADVVSTWTDLLRDALTGITVEQYWRLEPPESVTVYVEARTESGETGYAIGPHWASDYTVDVVIEAPWDDTVATAEQVSGLVETVKQTVAENREVLKPLVSTHGQVDWRFAQRPGSGVPVRIAVVPIENRFPGRGA